MAHPLLELVGFRPDSVMAVHYASTEVEKQASVTSIAAVHLEDFRTLSWSRREYSEEGLFDAFAKHMEANPRTLVGWNTSGPRYGYEALTQRAKTMSIALPKRQQYDLDDVMERLFGTNYCPHPKLANMSERNSLSMKDFLEGAAEAQLGKSGDFASLERSSERKARNIARLLLLAQAAKITQATQAADTFWAFQHPLVVQLAKPRFDSGHYSDAVLVSMVEMNSRLKDHVMSITGEELDGFDLMMKALNRTPAAGPLVQIVPSLASESERNMQDGYKFMMAGSMQAIRNPKAHANLTIDSQRCKLLLSCASLMLAKLADGGVDVTPH